ncbi:MAG: Dabb family protein [Nitrospirae bacterium]|nr:Dabb family protein [Nitrospirota bacterium]
MITHVVLFKLKDPSPENLQKSKEVLLNMEGKIPQLREIVVGVDLLRSPRSYDLALITKFSSMEDLNAYQEHPFHQKVIAYISLVRESSYSVDF